MPPVVNFHRAVTSINTITFPFQCTKISISFDKIRLPLFYLVKQKENLFLELMARHQLSVR